MSFLIVLTSTSCIKHSNFFPDKSLENVLIIIPNISLECGTEDTFAASICSRDYMYFTKYSPVLGALLDTELRTALIQNDGSFLLWQSPVALTRHRTYNFLTLDCQKFYSPFLKQSSLSLRVGLCCCWSYIYWHSVATVEDYGWLVHSNLKDKQVNDHYFIFIHVNSRFLTKSLHMA